MHQVKHAGRRKARICTLYIGYRCPGPIHITYADDSYLDGTREGTLAVVPPPKPPLVAYFSDVPTTLSLETEPLAFAILCHSSPGHYFILTVSQKTIRAFIDHALSTHILHTISVHLALHPTPHIHSIGFQAMPQCRSTSWLTNSPVPQSPRETRALPVLITTNPHHSPPGTS